MIRTMNVVNRVVMLKGVVGLRDLPPFNRLAGLRGVANIRHIDFPSADEARLTAAFPPNSATFVTPNHPEFFTDWMVDKEIASRHFPLAAFWATNAVVNGLGRLAQKFWLANNLIAQIPGNSEPAREHSIVWALKGHGVLLHPEGSVGWHGDFVAPLMPGAVEMALESLKRGRQMRGDFQAWIAPVVWKLKFTRDVEAALLQECAYVERRLRVERADKLSLPLRVLNIYETLLARDEALFASPPNPSAPFADRQAALVDTLCRRLAALLDMEEGQTDRDRLLRAARRRLREIGSVDSANDLKAAANALTLNLRLGAFAFAKPTVSQEELAEHIKRIRNDHCKGTMRDTLNRFIPQPAGPRTAHIRVPEPLAMHSFEGSVEDAVAELRSRMQGALDAINERLKTQDNLKTYPNPFYQS